MSEPTPNAAPNTDAAEDLPRDPKTGRFKPGHRVNETHGAITFLRHGVLPDVILEQERAFFREALTDLGGAESLSAIQMGYLKQLVRVDSIVSLLISYVSENGPLTPRGRQRSAVPVLLASLATWDRLASKLGLQRKAKRLPSALDVINAEDHDAT